MSGRFGDDSETRALMRELDSDGDELDSDGDELDSDGDELDSDGDELDSDGDELDSDDANDPVHLATRGESMETHSGELADLEWFYPMPLSKLVVFGLVGGTWFFFYWGYRCWRSYRDAWGYSREPFWRAVYAATGYRISPFWRAILSDFLVFCLFPAVHRECKRQGLVMAAAPLVLALCFIGLSFGSYFAEGPLWGTVFSPVWAVVPIQSGINRLHRSSGHRVVLGTSAVELLFVGIGGFLQWRA